MTTRAEEIAGEGQAIGEQTPAAWIIPSVFVGINKQVTLDPDVASAVRTNGGIAEPLYRSPISPEARDRAIEALESARKMLVLAKIVYKSVECGNSADLCDEALSALRGS